MRYLLHLRDLLDYRHAFCRAVDREIRRRLGHPTPEQHTLPRGS